MSNNSEKGTPVTSGGEDTASANEPEVVAYGDNAGTPVTAGGEQNLLDGGTPVTTGGDG